MQTPYVASYWAKAVASPLCVASHKQRLVLLVLATFLDEYLGNTWVSVATLARLAGVHADTAQRAISWAVANGWLKRELFAGVRPRDAIRKRAHRLKVSQATFPPGVTSEAIDDMRRWKDTDPCTGAGINGGEDTRTAAVITTPLYPQNGAVIPAAAPNDTRTSAAQGIHSRGTHSEVSPRAREAEKLDRIRKAIQRYPSGTDQEIARYVSGATPGDVKQARQVTA